VKCITLTHYNRPTARIYTEELANLSMYCVRRMYAMHAASSERKCTCGFRINVFIAVLLFFDSTAMSSDQPQHNSMSYD